jgi:hypothetical protein
MVSGDGRLVAHADIAYLTPHAATIDARECVSDG